MIHNPALHPLFELLAYFLGFQCYRYLRRFFPDSPLQDKEQFLSVFIGMLLGAIAGAKLLVWLYDPVRSFAEPPLSMLSSGKTIVGALLGGWLGVEAAKKLTGITQSTGDAIAISVLVGILIGRIGCFVAGITDNTHGLPTSVPWAYDFGDGIPRHPTQLYEILFLMLWAGLLWIRKDRMSRDGDLFKAMLAGYLMFRLLVDFIKPAPVYYLGSLSGIQLGCLAGLLLYFPHLPRLLRSLIWPQK